MKRILVFAVSLVFAWMAFHPLSAAAFGGRHGGGRSLQGLGFARLMDRLNCTRDQKGQVAAFLQSQRNEIDGGVTRLAAAREDLQKAMSAEPYSADAVTTAAQAVAAQEAQMIVLRAGIMNKVRQILTPDQLAQLQQMREKMAARRTEHVNAGLAALDKWIAQNSQ